jgi:type IV pilus assembly protein PilC
VQKSISKVANNSTKLHFLPLHTALRYGINPKTGVAFMTPQYRFSAKTLNGKEINSVISAANRSEALQTLSKNNMVPMVLKEKPVYREKLSASFRRILNFIGYRSYSNRDMMIFCRQFATLLEAGIAILQSLRILANQSEIATLKKPISAVARNVEEGSSLTSALRSYPESFPPIMINMIEVGEAGGMLDMIMEKLALHFEKQHDLQEKIRSATLYPIVIISVAIIVIAIMIVFVLPQFSQIFNSLGMPLPFFTRLLLSMGTFLRHYWFLFPPAALLVTVWLTWYTHTKKGRLHYDQIRLHFPLFGNIYRQTLAARFARIMGTLLSGGVTLHAALELVDKVIDNAVITLSIRELGAAVNRGESITEPLRKIAYFPALLSEMVSVGEETGALEQTLLSTAVFYEREVAYFVERLSSILEPLLLLIVGLFIGLLVYSVLSPMYQVFQMI